MEIIINNLIISVTKSTAVIGFHFERGSVESLYSYHLTVSRSTTMSHLHWS